MKTKFDLILSFDGLPQSFGNVEFDSPPSEAEVLKCILGNLTEEQTAKLRKISLCQKCERSDLLTWLEQNNGKYYFSA